MEDSNKEFEENLQQLNNLKDAIEHEMEEIDKAYDKIDKETTKSYEIIKK